MKTFVVAAKQAVEEEQAEEGQPWAEFGLAGQTFTISQKPTSGQGATVLAALSGSGSETALAVKTYLDNVLDGVGGRIIWRMLERGEIEFSVLWGGGDGNEEGIVDWIMGKASGGPTQGRTASSSSQNGTGKRSTGRSPGKGSTHSD